MLARMSYSRVWKTCIGAIVALIEEAAFKFSPEGVRMRAMDPSHVAMIDFELPARAFDEYEVGQPVVLGIALTELNRMLARARPEDEFTLELDEERNRLALTFKGKFTRRLSLPLIDVSETEPTEPEIEFTAVATLAAETVQDGLRDAEVVGDTVRFELDESGFRMSSESDRGSTELELKKEDARLELKEPARAMFTVKYLSDVIKAARSNDPLTLKLGMDLPIRVEFPVEDKGRLCLLLAPRIEAE